MCSSKAYVDEIIQISTLSSNPARAFIIMRHVMNTTTRLLRAEYITDLLDELIYQNVPLRSVKVGSEKLCKHLPSKRASATAMRVMKWKRRDAERALEREKRNNTKVWRESEKALRELGILDTYFTETWEEEKDYQRHQFDKKRRRKVRFLVNKYRKNKQTQNIPDEVEGISIKQCRIPADYNSNPRIYGGVTPYPSREVISGLSLPPMFTVYENVSPEQCEIEVEKSINKYRWSTMNGEKRIVDEGGKTVVTGTSEREWPLDYENNSIDFQRMRATDMPFNKRVQLPDPVDQTIEVSLQHLKYKLRSTTNAYCQQNKQNEFSNLTKKEKRGLREVSRDKDLVVFQTDKSGRFSIDTKNNYKEACAKHVPEEDSVVSEEVYQEYQKEINAHSSMWTRILKAGEGVHSGNIKAADRIRKNLTVQNHSAAPLYALRKDHKTANDRVIGPPTRPVCAANSAYNNKLSHVMCNILKPVWQNNEHVCESTEDLLATVKSVNSGDLHGNVDIGSLDVKALYPSLDINATADVVVKEFMDSEFKIEEVDVSELGLYLVLNLPKAELNKIGLTEYCPTRKHKVGAPPKMTGCASKSDKTGRFAPFNPPNSIPDDRSKKRMVAEAMKIAIKLIMNKHVYTFDGKKRKQAKGGPIGLDLTGDLAQIFMMYWEKEFLKRLERQGVEVLLYKRYVDDIVIALRSMDKRCMYVKDDDEEGRIQLGEEEHNEEADVHAMKILKEMGDDIHPSIQLEYECPSMHADKKMPVLDVKMWVETGERNKLLHEYYQKTVASKMVVHARSSLPWNTKRTVLTQEVLRILLRCSPELPWSTVKGHVETYMKRMQFAGYTPKFKGEVVRSAMKAYRKLVDMERQGVQPLYRPKNWKRVERQKERRKKKTNWFKRGGDLSVVFVPATPGSELKRRYEKCIKESGVGIKVVEKSGRTIKSLVQRTDPFQKKQCEDSRNCMICREEDSKGRCRQTGIVYEMNCKSCNSKYIGETSRNGYTRGLEHKRDYEKKDKNSVLYRHATQHHIDDPQPPQFSMKVMSQHKTALDRQVTEAVKIANTPSDQLINSKQEFGHNKCWRIELSAD